MNIFTALIVIAVAIIISLVVIMGLDMVLSQTQSQVLAVSGRQITIAMKEVVVRGDIGSGSVVNFTNPWRGSYVISNDGEAGSITFAGLPPGQAIIYIGGALYVASSSELVVPWQYPPSLMTIHVYLLNTTLGSSITLSGDSINVTTPATPGSSYTVIIEPGTCYSLSLEEAPPQYMDNLSLMVRTGCVSSSDPPLEISIPPGSYVIVSNTPSSLEVKNYVTNSIRYVSVVLAAILIASSAIIIIYDKTR